MPFWMRSNAPKPCKKYLFLQVFCDIKNSDFLSWLAVAPLASLQQSLKRAVPVASQHASIDISLDRISFYFDSFFLSKICAGNGLTLSPASKAQKISIPLQPQTSFKEMVDWAVENTIDLVVPGPEIPLVDGIHDAFKKGSSFWNEFCISSPPII